MLPPVRHLNTAIFAQFTALFGDENKTRRTLAAITATKQKLRDTVKLVQFFHEQSEKPNGMAWGERWFAQTIAGDERAAGGTSATPVY